MTLAAGRAFAAAALGAIAGAAWLAFFSVLTPALRVDLDVTPPARLVSGLYPVEREPDAGLTFAWTGPSMTLRLPGLDRNVEWILTVRARGARPGNDNPELVVLLDGVRVNAWPTAADYSVFEARLPARPERMGATIDLRSSATFVPGPADPRPLGVMLDWFQLSPAGIALPPRAAFAGVVTGAAAFGAALALLGMTAGSAVGAIVLVSAAQAALVAHGFGPYSGFPQTLARLSIAVGVAMVALVSALQAVRGAPLRNTARFVAAFSAAALVLKAGALMHPGMPIGDALFHAHRFRTVLGGNLYFTSVAPGNYLFPYAPGLYVFAAPFWTWLPRVSSDMAMLRFIVLAVDTAAAVLLYGLIVRARGDRLAGACAVALYHLIPLDFRIATVGNLTNAFAQSLGVVALAMAASGTLRLERRMAVIAFTVVLTATFLSHTGAFAIFAVAGLLVAALLWRKGGPAQRSPAAAVALAVVAAIVIAVVVYYAHFLETYRTEFSRISAETASGAPAPGGRTVLDRLAAVPRYLHIYLGVPALLLAAVGAGHLWRSGARDRLTLTIAGLALACLAFLVLGIVTPVDMRHYLAVIPAVAIAAGIGTSSLWSSGPRARTAALALLAWAAAIGVRTWWETIVSGP